MNNRTIFSTLFAVFVLLVLIRVFNISYPVSVTTTTKSTELSVVGEGKVEVVPDTANIDVGISVNNVGTVEQAQQQITKTNDAIITAMKALNIPKENIKTSNYSIYPNYIYEANQNRQSGYNGNVTISIKVKDVKLASRVIEEATKAGANQVQGTNFVVENPQKYREEARSKAIANAKEQAQKLAKDLNIKLGKVVNVVEFSPSTVVPMYDSANYMKGGAGGGGPMIETGSQTITSVVTLYFEKR
jgi:uncharacterized protein